MITKTYNRAIYIIAVVFMTFVFAEVTNAQNANVENTSEDTLTSDSTVGEPASIDLSPLQKDSTERGISDTVSITTSENTHTANIVQKFKPTRLIIPGSLIAVGIVGLGSDWLIYQNHEVRDELQESIRRKFTIDDFTQFAPTAAMYGLGLAGVRRKHNVTDQTIILGTAFAVMTISVSAIKYQTDVIRPDGSSDTSFPSGHTATAFMGAEMLRREYWDVSPWIGVGGYAVAAGTGFFRMYNNRHWLTDVIAGAGIGILSVDAAYWLYPKVSKLFSKRKHKNNICMSPYYIPNGGGVCLNLTF